VDDDPNLLVLVADQLRADGFETATADSNETGPDAVGASVPVLRSPSLNISKYASEPGGSANAAGELISDTITTLRKIREERGDHSLEFLGELSALDARAWLTQIDGIGKKTPSVLLLFCFGSPLLPIDRHVDRVLRRVGLLPAKASMDQAHDLVLGLFESDQMYEAHVNLIQHGRKICHAQRPNHDACPLPAPLPARGSEGAVAARPAARPGRSLRLSRPCLSCLGHQARFRPNLRRICGGRMGWAG
jgi:hypothetical protein